jgi:hypothetical protein
VTLVPADYGKIREENVRRYGWDTAVLDLLGQLYSERTHFIFELIQNAEDAGATELTFELFPDRLQVRHDGRPFTESDVRAICGVGQSEKSGDLTQIGKFGIGFKAVYAYTKTPRIHSGAEHFRIESYVRPFPVSAAEGPSVAEGPAAEQGLAAAAAPGTLFVFPFDHDEVPPPAAAGEIAAALDSFEPRTLLFLRNIARIRISGPETASQVVSRAASARDGTSRHVTLSRRGERGREEESWFAWHRQLGAPGQPGHRVEIAFRVSAVDGEPRLVRSESSPLVVFFPTQKETFLGFWIQGPYRTTPARDNVPEHDAWNQELARETAALLAGVLRELRDEGLLTAEVLAAMPVDKGRFEPGSMLRAVYESARDALGSDELIPAAGGGYGTARDLKLARGGGLRELLAPGQLGELYGDGGPVGFADESITENRPDGLWRYLREDVGVEEVTPEAVVARLTQEFLAAQPDEWIARCYAFLYRHHALWREPGHEDEPPGPARAKPVIRLEDGGQVAPFGKNGRPAAYLPSPAAHLPGPGSTETELPTVRRAVADVPAARQFLEALGFAEPDVVSEVLDIVLPRYDGLDVAELDPAQHDADLERVARALDEAAPAQRERVLGQLRQTTFLIGENAATGERRLMTPPSLYERSKDLETYFDGNPGAWFADDTYGPWRAQLHGMGVRDEVELRVRKADLFGHVVVVSEFARHERGIDGFDPGAEFDGLDFALSHPGHARSEYIWNTLLVPRRQLVAGVVEKATRQEYQDARQEHVLSVMGTLAAGAAWLPGPDGTFRCPAEVQLDDLPPAFERDEGLARALGMVQAAVVEEAARQLGVPADVLRGLARHPDLVARIRQELGDREGRGRPGPLDEPGT